MKWVGENLPKRLVVGVADMVVTNDLSAEVVTYSLGSCLGISAYDTQKKIGGILHAMLPNGNGKRESRSGHPHMYIDKSFPRLLKMLEQLGANKKQIELKIVGGAYLMDKKKYFRIGERNIELIEKLAQEKKLYIAAKRVGGNLSRSIRLILNSGELIVKDSKGKVETI